MHDITDFDKPVSTYSPTIADIVPRLSPQSLEMFIDLAPYTNPPSFVVQENTTASKVCCCACCACVLSRMFYEEQTAQQAVRGVQATQQNALWLVPRLPLVLLP